MFRGFGEDFKEKVAEAQRVFAAFSAVVGEERIQLGAHEGLMGNVSEAPKLASATKSGTRMFLGFGDFRKALNATLEISNVRNS